MANTSQTALHAPGTHYSVAKLLLLALTFHLIYIYSVFDCYFTSPVIHGMRSFNSIKPYKKPPAERLVLIVGDGLRADLLFNLNAFPDIPGSPEVVAPHLRLVAEGRGAFGISHTRVPTESRPGHVAIIGGMYEDVSAVTKGWKTNPVDFDSVFNRSSVTFSFGSPDILPMFARGATPGKVKTWCYDEDEEDFTKDATALDVWVLDQLKVLLNNATTDAQLNKQLHGDKVVFFLHLLGLDTTGHSYRPHSKEYMQNIQVVDNIVRETEILLSQFYNDEKTAYIFTADHGMSAIGNHGDGHPDNTRTPLLAWGAGIRGPLPDTTPSTHDAYSSGWGLSHLYRRDVEQADIASLMSALLGINWPVNSVGVLPDVYQEKHGYLDQEKLGADAIARAALVNARVLEEQYRVKHEAKQKHAIFYKPYRLPLSRIRFAEVWGSLDVLDFVTARSDASRIIQESLEGLHYLQTYDRFLIRGVVTFAYLGWAAYAALHVLKPRDKVRHTASGQNSPTSKLFVNLLSLSVLFAFWTVFAIQRNPWTYFVYLVFPVWFWRRVVLDVSLVWTTPKMPQSSANTNNVAWYLKSVFGGAFVVGSLLGMVAGYTHRSLWSLGFILIGVGWPLTVYTRLSAHPKVWAFWTVSCLVTAVFPLLSVDKTESLTTIMAGGILILLSGYLGFITSTRTTNITPESRTSIRNLWLVQSLLVILTMLITTSSIWNLQSKQGLPLVNQVAGWALLFGASVLPFVYPDGKHKQAPPERSKSEPGSEKESASRSMHTPYTKILMYFLGFGPCFVILSISVEGLFFVAYSATLVGWIGVESVVRGSGTISAKDKQEETTNGAATSTEKAAQGVNRYQFRMDDLRIALFFLFFVQVGFFGTGNVASISSFYLAPVYRLIPIFNPFYMTALLMFKIIAPYVMLAATFAVLNEALGLPPFSLLLVALTISDGMTLTFFYKVQDTGSWLEIGQSITFFCIASLLLLWAGGICAVGEVLMGSVIHGSSSRTIRQKGE